MSMSFVYIRNISSLTKSLFFPGVDFPLIIFLLGFLWFLIVLDFFYFYVVQPLSLSLVL